MSSEIILKSLPKNTPSPYRVFATAFMAGLQKEDFADHKPADITAALEGIWKFGKKRTKDETLVGTHIVSGSKKGWLHERTRIFIVSSDRAFIIDSVTAELNRRNLSIRTLFHPVLSVKRDAKGEIVSVGSRDDGKGTNESWLVIDVQGAIGATQSRILEQDITRVMDDVMLATRDWPQMKAALRASASEVEQVKVKNPPIPLSECASFLRYLHDDNFTLLGYREYRFSEKDKQIVSSIVPGRSMGLLSNERMPVYINKSSIPLPQDLQRMRLDAPVVSVYKVNRRSSVHRHVPLDAVTIKIYDSKGKATGEKLFIGLFTSVTYSRSVADVPLIREKVKRVINDAKFAKDSHDYRAIAHILEKYPRDELFQMSVPQIADYASGILRLQDRPRVALYPRVDEFRRYISCLVYVPRDRYETNLRLAIQHILEKDLDGKCDNFYTTLDDSPLARIMYIITTEQRIRRDYDFEVIERKLVEASRTWPEKLRYALMESTADERRAIELAMSYDTAFDLSYQESHTPASALADIAKIEESIASHRIALDFQKSADGGIRLKLYHPHKAAALSDVMPVLENMGLRVEAELPFEVCPQEGAVTVWIHEIQLKTPAGASIDFTEVKANAEAALMATWYGQAENDTLNALVLTAGLEWRDVVILRAYTKYMQQARVSYTPAYISKALTDHPTLASALVGLFHAMHDPSLPDSKRRIREWESSITTGLEAVKILDQDRIIRFIKSLIDATLRTNFYQRDEAGHLRPALSLKFDSVKVMALPDPRPWREIFVYSPRMEGIHLRTGKISRGGIRWSDRPEDFRTEILGLMQAQQVKNAVIVPEGAKGGFILKKLPEGATREQTQAEGIECYKMLVRGMLDITDNLKGETVIHPPHVVRHDGDDPYLVVAADKGTATFSDIANGLSAEYGFWLGDAFASGGSAGYDHKEVGITARGAWECIKRHFRELGKDIQKEAFDVIGVGDMGGDVFGNGMLLSRHICLVGAFNHQHIFCDPNPDPATTFKERERLFHGVKGWGDYDQKLLSKGGRIFNRSEKSLVLTKEIRDRFGISSEKVSPSELMNAMLKSKCDLLYFGGIGTYVKASSQTHQDAGDRANDACRVDASEVNAKVIGEGANLALTRRARVELGLKGIKLNADFIDNSGGVDCSDHEVNIKILLQDLTGGTKPELNLKQRNALLKEMTDEVAGLVLRNNHQQSQAISLAELDAVECLPVHGRLIDMLERKTGMKRTVEGLPSSAEIEARQRDHKGLTRSELATLISLAKIQISKAMLAGGIPDDPLSEDWLMHYFPEKLAKKYPKQIRRHRLRREIMATQMTASIVNRLGPAFIMTMEEKRGVDVETIARASFLAREAYDLRPLWHGLEVLDGKIPASVQLKSMKQISRLIEATSAWILRHGNDMVGKGSLADKSVLMRACIKAIEGSLKDALPQARRQRMIEAVNVSAESGLPPALGAALANLGPLRSAPDIIRVTGPNPKALPTAATVFFHVGDDLHFDFLRQQARLQQGASFWQSEAIDGVIGQLYSTQADLTRRILAETDAKKPALRRLEAWKDQNVESLRQYEMVLADMRRVPQLSLAMLMLAEQRLRQFCK
ncbi:MAG: NAD-glutamate dehydrogenase [Proteobacteria bacterium]|nr:NAD-glutamate dehydrogenase [Pseudomonadota bacterium]